jgi:HK97 family phage portal protein
LFGIELSPARRQANAVAAAPVSSGAGRGWFPMIIREPFTGAWQQNQEITVPTALSYVPVFACTTLIAQDIGKMRLRLVEYDAETGVWTEAASNAFSPVLRRPNRYQLINKFLEQWIVSKLSQGNAYVLLQRDRREVVVAMYVLDPSKVTPLVAPDGSVFYKLGSSDLVGLPDGFPAVPASEIIHDPMVPLFHPLIGVSPIYACGLTALQGMKIQDNSTTFFATGSNPGGVLTAPGAIDDATAKRLKDYWDSNYSGANVGKVAILGDGLKYEAMSVNAVDAQLIEQLKWTTEAICACFHVPAALIDASHQPPYANSEPLVQQYYSQCLQTLIVSLELHLDDGLGLTTVAGHTYGTEFDIDDLLWMDTATRTKAATDSVTGGVLKIDEARRKYFGVGPVVGGDTPYMQQQMVSVAALAERDATDWLSKPAPVAPPPPPPDDDLDLASFASHLTAGVFDVHES